MKILDEVETLKAGQETPSKLWIQQREGSGEGPSLGFWSHFSARVTVGYTKLLPLPWSAPQM